MPGTAHVIDRRPRVVEVTLSHRSVPQDIPRHWGPCAPPRSLQ